MFIVDSTMPRLLASSGDLLVTGTADDPFYVQSPQLSDHEHNIKSGKIHRSNERLLSVYSLDESVKPLLKAISSHSTVDSTHLNDKTDLSDTNEADYVITRTPCNIIDRGGYYKHKFLLKLRKKQYNNNFDLGLYFLIKFGGPNTTMGLSIIKDDELLECSQMGQLKGHGQIEQWYKEQYNSLLEQFNKLNGFNKPNGYEGFKPEHKYALQCKPTDDPENRPTNVPTCSTNVNKMVGYTCDGNAYQLTKQVTLNPNNLNLQGNGQINKQPKMTMSRLNKKLSKLICSKKWFAREKLYTKVVEQQNWNPFSIFGSSIPYVSLNNVFNVESSGNYVVGSIKQGVINRINGHMNSGVGGHMGSKHTQGSNRHGSEPDEMNSVGENVTNAMMMNYLKKKWTNESKRAINWNHDPLLNVEVLWYINSTGRHVDKSRDVCILQRCFCTTPDPHVRFNWNDPRNQRDSPRGSMGFLLDSAGLKRARSGYEQLRCRLRASGGAGPSRAGPPLDTQAPSAESEAQEHGRSGNAGAGESGIPSLEDATKLTYYASYFRHNAPASRAAVGAPGADV